MLVVVVTEVVLEETGVNGVAERDMAIVGFHRVYRKEDKELENVQGKIKNYGLLNGICGQLDVVVGWVGVKRNWAKKILIVKVRK